jgi:hypothetical protein
MMTVEMTKKRELVTGGVVMLISKHWKTLLKKTRLESAKIYEIRLK